MEEARELAVTVEEPELTPSEPPAVVEAAGVTAELLTRVTAQGLMQEQMLATLQDIRAAVVRAEAIAEETQEDQESEEEAGQENPPEPISVPPESQSSQSRGPNWLHKLLVG